MTAPKDPNTSPSRPARFKVNGGGKPLDRASTVKVSGSAEPRPPRSIDGHWQVEPGIDEAEPVFISQVTVRHPDQITAKATFDEMNFHVSVRACSCCGRPFVTSLLLVGSSPNLASIWSRDRRLDVGMACYGIAHRAGLRGLLPPKP